MVRQLRLVATVSIVIGTLGAGPVRSQQATTPPTIQSATPPPPPKGFILGRVVDAGSGRGVPGAIVTLQAPNEISPAVSLGLAAPEEIVVFNQNTPQVIADGEGRFVFRALGKGSYGLSVRAPGFVIGAYGQRRPNGPSRRITLEEDQKFTEATLRIWKFASIAGRLVDESGEPSIGTSVNLARVTMIGGRRQLTSAGSASTDDRGQYRFGSLIPGTYLVHVRSSTSTLPVSVVDAYLQGISSGSANDLPRELIMMGSSNSGLRIGDHQLSYNSMFGRSVLPPPPGADGRLLIYQTLFYPSAATSSQATSITLGSGEERTGIDMQLKLARAVSVSGVLQGPDGPAGMIALRLQPDDLAELSSTTPDAATALTSMTAPDGSFVFLGVPPGAYTLHALKVPRAPTSGASSMTTVIQMGGGGMMMTSSGPSPPAALPTDPTLWARVPVSIGETDVRDLVVSLNRGVRISGKVEFAGTATRPTPERLAQLSVNLSNPELGILASFTPARLSADGSFTTMSYPPGRYTLFVGSPGPPWTIRSISAGGKDAFTTPLEVGTNDLAGVIVTFGDVTTELSGTVAAGATTRGEAVVVVFPLDIKEWIDSGMSARRSRTIGTSTAGDYRITGLPAGDYLGVAVDASMAVDLQDPQFVNAAARAASRVTLADGEKKSLSLTLTTIR